MAVLFLGLILILIKRELILPITGSQFVLIWLWNDNRNQPVLGKEGKVFAHGNNRSLWWGLSRMTDWLQVRHATPCTASPLVGIK